MPTPFESAELILKLYEQRREPTMRKARDFVTAEFDPRTFEEYMAGIMGPNSGLIRMVVSYWDMAASFVRHGAIDETMFVEASAEFILPFARVEPFLPKIREAFGNPNFLSNLEWLVMRLPNARQRIDGTLERMRRILAMRASQGQK
jgi:hypothetical protein